MKLSIVTTVLLVAVPAFGLDYPCPSDPGFCYFDAGNDGCFNGGTDTGPIDADLEAGTYPPMGPPTPGSIVCPPSVKKLTVTASASWTTAPGGDVLLYCKKIVTPGLSDLSVFSGQDVLIAGLIRVRNLIVDADRDIAVAGKIKPIATLALVDFTAHSGAISFGPRAMITGGRVYLETTGGGEIALLEKSVIKTTESINVLSSGDLSLAKVKLKARSVDLDGESVVGSGYPKITALAHDITILAVTTIEFERVKADVKGQFSDVRLSGASIRVGIPNSRGVVRRSSFKSGSQLDLDATGDILLDEVYAQTSQVRVDTPGTLVEVTNSRFSLAKKSGANPDVVEVNAGAGSTCDVSNTIVKDMTFTVNCDTVIGP